MKKAFFYLSLVAFLNSCSCENREVNPEVGPSFSEIHENLEYNFDKIDIDGYQYLLLERDRNNPHEGFGFMALHGNSLGGKQDTIQAYLKTILELQTEILSKLNSESLDATNKKVDKLLQKNMGMIKTTPIKE